MFAYRISHPDSKSGIVLESGRVGRALIYESPFLRLYCVVMPVVSSTFRVTGSTVLQRSEIRGM